MDQFHYGELVAYLNLEVDKPSFKLTRGQQSSVEWHPHQSSHTPHSMLSCCSGPSISSSLQMTLNKQS